MVPIVTEGRVCMIRAQLSIVAEDVFGWLVLFSFFLFPFDTKTHVLKINNNGSGSTDRDLEVNKSIFGIPNRRISGFGEISGPEPFQGRSRRRW